MKKVILFALCIASALCSFADVKTTKSVYKGIKASDGKNPCKGIALLTCFKETVIIRDDLISGTAIVERSGNQVEGAQSVPMMYIVNMTAQQYLEKMMQEAPENCEITIVSESDD